MKKVFIISILLYFLVSSISCQKSDNIHSNIFIDFGKEGLIQNKEYAIQSSLDSVLFSKKNHSSINLVVRYTDSCKIKTLPLQVETILSSDDSIKNFKVELELFDDYGKNKGSGNFGIYEIKYPLIENNRIDHEFKISIMTEEKQTEGIISLGITVY